MSTNIHEDDVGTRFTLNFVDDDTGEPIPLQQATIMEAVFVPPIEAAFSRDCTFTTDGSDGSVYYDSVAGDLIPEGDWELQGYAEGPTFKNSTEIREFEVGPKRRSV